MTKRLPGPKILSTRGIERVPYASAAIACAPPTRATASTPSVFGGGQQRGARLRACDDDFAHAGFLRGNHRHQQRRDERKSPAGKIAADRIDGAHALAGAHARLDFDRPFLRLLPARDGADIARGVIDRGEKIARDTFARRCQFRARNPHRASASSATRSKRFVHAKSAASPRRRTSATMRAAIALGIAAAMRGATPALFPRRRG